MQYTDKPTLYQRWARCLVNFYPAGWRERYGEEMLMILEDSTPTLKTILNLLLNLFDAYLHQNLVAGRTPHMLQRMRSNELAIYGATLIFFVAWFVAQLYVTVPGQPIIFSHSFVFTSSLLVNIIHAVSDVLLLCILFGGLPIVLAACWKALMARKPGALLLCCLGLISPFVTVFMAAILPFLLSTFTTVKLGMGGTWLWLFIYLIGLGVDVALISFAVQRVAPSRRVTHYGLVLAMLIPAIMFVGLVALLLWIFLSLPEVLAAGGVTHYIVHQAFLMLVMVGMLSFSLIALIKGWRTRRGEGVMIENKSEMVM